MAERELYHSRILEQARDHTDTLVVIEGATSSTYDIGSTHAGGSGKAIKVTHDPRGFETGDSRTVLVLRYHRAWV